MERGYAQTAPGIVEGGGTNMHTYEWALLSQSINGDHTGSNTYVACASQKKTRVCVTYRGPHRVLSLSVTDTLENLINPLSIRLAVHFPTSHLHHRDLSENTG